MKNTVKMLKTTLGCDDGVVIPDTYFEGKTYDIGDDLLAGFIEQGVVEVVGATTDPEGRETKVTGPDETKPAKPAKAKKATA